MLCFTLSRILLYFFPNIAELSYILDIIGFVVLLYY